ncbi:MAG: hypothetical protein QHI48_08255, partial [Bacteroidota bacterium]|nr:hypothetical protein [Bacteroidota bacterium]
FLHVCGIPYDRYALAEALARAERYAGIEGGGMDQAVSLLARDGHALRIDFFPLRARPVPFPAGVHIVVCDSLVEAAKTGGARRAYNTRVVECKLAAVLIAREYERKTGLAASVERIADLDALFASCGERVREACVGAALDGDVLPLGEIALRLGMSPECVLQTYCRTRGGETVAPPPMGFAVGPRYRHVVSEAARVEEAEQALGRGDAQRFGELMNASHESCREAYEVSCGELERLVACAREAGALGARLTGAGFGGCTVNLVASENMESFLRAMRGMYRRERAEVLEERGVAADDAVFVCHPVAGASVVAGCGDDAGRTGNS